MAEDIAPALLEKLQKVFAAKLEKIKLDAKTYSDAFDCAEAIGTALAETFAEHLSGADLPDGRMYWNIANAVVKPLLEQDHALVSTAAAGAQDELNKAAGLGVKAQKAKLNNDRVSGILNRLASEERYDAVAWILQEPVITFSLSVVDDTVRANAEFQAKAGLETKLIRTMKGKGCAWCRALAGVYDYGDAPKDVYRRHDNCRCVVEVVGSRGRDVVHSGTEGKRRYVQDRYGGYEMTAEARAERRKAMEPTAEERAKAAREKRIATWAKKKQKGWTEDAAPDKIEARKALQTDNDTFRVTDYQKVTALNGDSSAKTDWEKARTGGRHSGIYQDAAKKSKKQLQKSISSHTEQVKLHADKVKHPDQYDSGWANKTPQQQAGLLKKWRKDMERNAQQANVEIYTWKERFGDGSE